MFTVCTDDYTLILQDRGLPSMADEYTKRASLNDYFETSDERGDWCYVGVTVHHSHRLALLARP